MRQVRVVICALVALLGAAGPAHAWWGWIDELSGPKGFHGFQFELRTNCFGAKDSPIEKEIRAFLQAERELGGRATDLRARLTILIPVPSPERDLLLRQLGQMAAESARWEQEYAPAMERLLGTYITSADLDGIATSFVVGLNPSTFRFDSTFLTSVAYDGDSRLSALVRGLQRQEEQWNHLRKRASSLDALRPSAFALPVATGLRVSTCGAREDEQRKQSLNWLMRFYSKRDNAAEIAGPDTPPDDREAYANGYPMHMFTVGPLWEFRPFFKTRDDCSVRDCQERSRLDVVDLGASAGLAWIYSFGFQTIVKPTVSVHADFHLPSWKRSKRGARTVPQLRVAAIAFPGGFDANAFGPKLTGRKARASDNLDAHIELSVFFDLGSIF